MNPQSLDIPYSLESERLTLRGPLPGDGRPLRQAVIESQEQLLPWLPFAVDIPSEPVYESIVREGQLKFLARKDLWLLLFLKDSDTIVGSSGLHRIDWSVPSFEMGYWVRSAYAGRGYITEAVECLTQFAVGQLGARRLEIRCDAENERSAAMARRLGFTHEGTLRQQLRHFSSGELRDTMLFAKVI